MSDSAKNGIAVASMLFVVFVLGVLSYLAFTVPDVDDERSPRIVIAKQLGSQLELGPDQRLTAAPWLHSEIFQVGTVFPIAGSYAIAESVACDKVTTESIEQPLSIGDDTSYAVNPELKLESIGALNVETVRAVEYSVEISNVHIAPAMSKLLEEMYSDADCLAAVANREVMVLYGLYKGNEHYKMKRKMSGAFNFSIAINNIKENLGFSGEVEDGDTVSRPNSTVYWALTKIQLDEPAFGSGIPLSYKERIEIAESILTSEAPDYFNQGIPNTKIVQPTVAEIENVFSVVSKVDQ